MKKIDIFNHIWPDRFYQKLKSVVGEMTNITMRSEQVPMMTDLDERFRVMDRFADYSQILSLASPPLEIVAKPADQLMLSQVGTDDMAELCQKYPERFPGFIASIPMGDPEVVLAETKRAISAMGAAGVQVFSNIKGKPLDHPDFAPVFDYMAEIDKPIWIHPARGASFADYQTEETSLYEIWWTFGWPYDTSVAMARLVFSRLFDRHPGIKIITHHGGAMIPFFEGRVGPGWDQLGARTSSVDYSILLKELKKRPLDYFKMFYADTAVFGSKAATECCLSFFGADHVVFASDAPFDPEKGPMYIRETIKVIDSLDISEEERAKIYHGNAIKLLGLPG
ncbi:MAG: amidohydrolase family protein [Pseudomonadales bacterium]|nr:amidohydrolase family protein [Pseudomonadales bacterium]